MPIPQENGEGFRRLGKEKAEEGKKKRPETPVYKPCRHVSCKPGPSASRTENISIVAAVIARQREDWILRVENKGIDEEKAYFRLSPKSESIGRSTRSIRLRDTVVIREIEPVLLDPRNEVDYLIEPRWHVISYELKEERHQQLPSTEILAVAEVREHYILLVGTSFSYRSPGLYFRGPDDVAPAVGQFMAATIIAYSPGICQSFKMYPGTDTKYFYFSQETGSQERVEYVEDLKPLTGEENIWINSRLREKEWVTLDEAERYIRDPHIAAEAVEFYCQDAAIHYVTVKLKEIKKIFEEQRQSKLETLIEIELTPEQYFKCFLSGIRNWKWERDLVIKSKEGDLTIEVRYQSSKRIYLTMMHSSLEKYAVTLSVKAGSKRVAQILLNGNMALEHEWTVGPLDFITEAAITTIKRGFSRFFWKMDIFEQFQGKTAKRQDLKIPKIDEPMRVRGNLLDSNQLAFVRSAAVVSGWTCAQGPPGSGKTLAASALIGYLLELKVDGGVCISGSSNAAVTNAAVSVMDDFPDIKIVQNYSYCQEKKGIDEDDNFIGLRHMGQNFPFHLREEEVQEMPKLRERYERNVWREDTAVYRSPGQVARLQKDTHMAKKDMKKGFLKAYKMEVYGATVDRLITGGDKFIYGTAPRSEERMEKSIKWLILDEAAQLSPIEALALYCQLPQLTHIALLGDPGQLSPHTYLPKESDAYLLKSIGEISRMSKLPSTIKKNFNCLYRSNPLLTEKVLTPIYGNGFENRVPKEKRTLAEEKKLPRTADGTPLIMYNVVGEEKYKENSEEAQAVLNLLIDLTTIGVEEEDIAVLSFHHNQMISIKKKIEASKGLKGKIKLNTVTCFQGKEAKVVILCTKKSAYCEESQLGKIQFIGEAERATVALNRAQEAFYVIGNLEMLARSPIYAKMMAALPRDAFKDSNLRSPMNENAYWKMINILKKTLPEEMKRKTVKVVKEKVKKTSKSKKKAVESAPEVPSRSENENPPVPEGSVEKKVEKVPKSGGNATEFPSEEPAMSGKENLPGSGSSLNPAEISRVTGKFQEKEDQIHFLLFLLALAILIIFILLIYIIFSS